jgi:hypothetical protein
MRFPDSHVTLRGIAASMLAASLLFGTTGCCKATFINPAVVPGETHEEWTDFFIVGLVGKEEFDVREFCPGEAAKVATGGNFLTGLVTVVTLGIYAPRKVYVTCAAGPAVVPGAMPTALPPGFAPQPTMPASPPAATPPGQPANPSPLPPPAASPGGAP